jgi:hypothetical protein
VAKFCLEKKSRREFWDSKYSQSTKQITLLERSLEELRTAGFGSGSL